MWCSPHQHIVSACETVPSAVVLPTFQTWPRGCCDGRCGACARAPPGGGLPLLPSLPPSPRREDDDAGARVAKAAGDDGGGASACMHACMYAWRGTPARDAGTGRWRWNTRARAERPPALARPPVRRSPPPPPPARRKRPVVPRATCACPRAGPWTRRGATARAFPASCDGGQGGVTIRPQPPGRSRRKVQRASLRVWAGSCTQRRGGGRHMQLDVHWGAARGVGGVRGLTTSTKRLALAHVPAGAALPAAVPGAIAGAACLCRGARGGVATCAGAVLPCTPVSWLGGMTLAAAAQQLFSLPLRGRWKRAAGR